MRGFKLDTEQEEEGSEGEEDQVEKRGESQQRKKEEDPWCRFE